MGSWTNQLYDSFNGSDMTVTAAEGSCHDLARPPSIYKDLRPAQAPTLPPSQHQRDPGPNVNNKPSSTRLYINQNSLETEGSGETTNSESEKASVSEGGPAGDQILEDTLPEDHYTQMTFANQDELYVSRSDIMVVGGQPEESIHISDQCYHQLDNPKHVKTSVP